MLTNEFLKGFRTANLARREQAYNNAHWTAKDWIACLLGEIGEAIDACKKLRIHSEAPHAQRGTLGEYSDLTRDYQHEIVDCFVYLDLACIALNAGDQLLLPVDSILSSAMDAILQSSPNEMASWALTAQSACRLMADVNRGNHVSGVFGMSLILADLIVQTDRHGWDFEVMIREKFNITSEKIGCEVRL